MAKRKRDASRATRTRKAVARKRGAPKPRAALRNAPLGESPAAGDATVKTDAKFKLIDVPGTENTSQEFKDKVVQIAERLGTNPNFLMAVMSFESGGTFSPSVPNKAGSGAVGLIQFMPATAKGLGTSSEALVKMSAETQLDFVEKHYRPFKGRLKTIEDTYMAVLLPKAVGKGNDFVLFQKPSVAFDQNKGLDIDRDGRITVFDASFKVRQLLTSAGRGTGQILRMGSTGPEVEMLQDELIGLGHLRPEEKAGGPGTFGPRTERTLKELQSANGLIPSGILDAATHDVIRQINNGLGVGSRGSAVGGLQQRLVKLGNMTNAQVASSPDIFDIQTEAALRQFQLQLGIEPSGVLTVEAYRSLLTAVPVLAPSVPASAASVDTLLPVAGRGFTTFNRDPGGADQFGRASTVLAIQTLGAAWAETHSVPIFVGDISRKGGGAFSPHSSHKDGRDVDLRPFRHNGEPGATNINDPSYDHALTRELVVLVGRKFADVRILFNDRALVTDGLTKPFAGHDNHLHVRFS
jgi:peptidoglycan hydrolase-like protein with peptidoglycan-binding domain